MTIDIKKDNEWSRKVKERDRYRCRFGYKGCTGKATDACHIFSRSFKKLRWVVDNGLAGCRKCHSKSERNTKVFELDARRLVGEDIWKELVGVLAEVYGVIK